MALVALPYKTPLEVNVAAPVPPLVTVNVPVTLVLAVPIFKLPKAGPDVVLDNSG